ncbi:imidazolonepropionase [bacterium]|nr:imidazolonepropionase [bacterium]
MIDLLISPCRQVVGLAGDNAKPRRGQALSDLGLIEHGAVGISVANGTIEYVGPVADLDSSLLSASCPVLDAANCVVMPGFVDSHTHLVFGGSRADEFFRRTRGETYQEISRSGGGINKTVQATRQTSGEDLFRSAQQRLLQLYNNGTTTVEIKSGYGLDFENELKMLEVISHLAEVSPGLILGTFLGAHFFPPEYKENRAGYVAEVIRQLEHVADHSLADFYDIFIDPLAFSRDEAEQIVAAAQYTSLALRLHADEFGDDGTAAWGVNQGALSCDHLGGIGPEGIAALAASDTVATLLPATMFFSGHGEYAPARKLIEAGCAVALASDLNPGSSLVYSLPLTMTLAALNMAMSAEECITACTINAAHALGLASLIGSLEQGKRADVIVLNVPHYEEIAYHVGCEIVRDVIIRGRVIKRNGGLVLQQLDRGLTA